MKTTPRKRNYQSRVPPVLMLLGLGLLLAACAGPERRAAVCDGVEQATGRLFLQQVTASSAIIKWRGDADVVCAGAESGRLDIRVAAEQAGSHKLARLTGLDADTVYYYSIGGAAVGDESRQFRTAPAVGEVPGDGNTHIWLLGDSGTATEFFRGAYTHPGEALAVKEGFLKYNREQAGGEALDLLLLLGDNAYLEGTDAQWQGAFFDIYPEIISRTSTWPTIGNHEMGAAPLNICLFGPLPGCDKGPVMMSMGGISESSDPASYDSDGKGPDEGGMPYLSIFTLPSRGEAGGVASGTEQYYSFDHGNVHVVSLDSQLSNRDPAQRSAMRDWLISDLQHNQLSWTIVIFHHPPYSKGENHDSDLEQAEVDMRETFVPVFEDYGVDVVYSGHAHTYERSWYLHGHYGAADTFDPQRHAELTPEGVPATGQGEQSYRQITRSGKDDKAVYTVSGSAGKADELHPCPEGQHYGCTPENWLMHPAHREFDDSLPDHRPNGIARKGSVVLDIGASKLTSRFIGEHGEVLDYFVIER